MRLLSVSAIALITFQACGLSKSPVNLGEKEQKNKIETHASQNDESTGKLSLDLTGISGSEEQLALTSVPTPERTFLVTLTGESGGKKWDRKTKVDNSQKIISFAEVPVGEVKVQIDVIENGITTKSGEGRSTVEKEKMAEVLITLDAVSGATGSLAIKVRDRARGLNPPMPPSPPPVCGDTASPSIPQVPPNAPQMGAAPEANGAGELPTKPSTNEPLPAVGCRPPPREKPECAKVTGFVTDLKTWSQKGQYFDSCALREYKRFGYVEFDPNETCAQVSGNVRNKKTGEVINFKDACHQKALLSNGYELTKDKVICNKVTGFVIDLKTWSKKGQYFDSCALSEYKRFGYVQFDPNRMCGQVSGTVKHVQTGEQVKFVNLCHREALIMNGYMN